jgi:hypothetical protein
MNFKEIGWEIWAGLMWFRTGVSGQYCQKGTKIFASTKNGVLWLAKWLLFSEEGCCLVKSFSFLSASEHWQTIYFCSFLINLMWVGLLLISSVKHIQFIVKNTFKATCFGSTEPSSGLFVRKDPYLITSTFGIPSVYNDGIFNAYTVCCS